MQTAIIKTESKADFKLILNIAKKIGIQTKVLTKQEIEEISLANAIKKGHSGEYIDIRRYLKKISK